ncbi:MAG: hypothetical protein EOO29_33055 [Comamonadaceae bacterium]|nr:MAG: hypothetical protein EOO29_33055 [Comamonadaceae bacterium]
MKTAYSHLASSPYALGKIEVRVPRAVLCALGRADSEPVCLELMARLGYALDTLVRLRRPRSSLDVSIDDVPALRLMAASDGLTMPRATWPELAAHTRVGL